MYNMYKFNNENINKSVFETEFNNKCSYYGNVVMWTTMFALPLFFLLDYLFYSDGWVDLVCIRLIGFGLSFLVYTLFRKNHWSYNKTITWFVAVNVFVQAFICGIVPSLYVFPFFIMLAIYLLIVCNTIFWDPRKSLLIFLASLLLITAFFYFKNRPDKFEIMIGNGGGIYIALGLIACLLSYTRFKSLCKDIENNVVNGKIEAAPTKKEAPIKAPIVENVIEEPKVEIVNKTIEPLEPTINENFAAIEQPLKTAESFVEEKVAYIEKEVEPTFNLEPIKDIPQEISLNEVEETSAESNTNLADLVAPAVTVIAPVVAQVVDNASDVSGTVAETVAEIAPVEKPKKSIHEEIEDTIRLLRGEKPKDDFSPVQNFVSNITSEPESKAILEVETPQVREELINNTTIDHTFDNTTVVEEQVVEINEAPIVNVEDSNLETSVVEALELNQPTSSVIIEKAVDFQPTTIDVVREKINLNEVVETTIIDLIDTIHLKDQSIQLNISPAANYVFQEKKSLNKTIGTITQHVLRYSPSGSIITCNAEKENGKAVVELTSHAAVDSGEKLKTIAENYKTLGLEAQNLVESVGLGGVKEEIEKMGGSLYYNHANDNSNYLKLELPSTQ
jgi:hypothetical protein